MRKDERCFWTTHSLRIACRWSSWKVIGEIILGLSMLSNSASMSWRRVSFTERTSCKAWTACLSIAFGVNVSVFRTCDMLFGR